MGHGKAFNAETVLSLVILSKLLGSLLKNDPIIIRVIKCIDY